MQEPWCELVSAQRYPPQVLADLLTAAYADYPLPIYVTAEILARMVDKWDIDLARSVVAVVDDHPAGLALLAHRARSGWISGVGVVKAYRHRGIARAMLVYLQQQARMLGLETVSLEVLEENVEASGLYAHLGFRSVGAQVTVSKVTATAPWVSWDAQAFESGSILPMDAEFALAFYSTFEHPRTAWVRSQASLHKLCAYGLKALGYFSERTLQGYLLYTAGMGTLDIYDLAVQTHEAQTRTIAAALLQTVERGADGFLQSYAISVAEEDPLLEVYQALGYEVLYREYAMLWHQTNSGSEGHDIG